MLSYFTYYYACVSFIITFVVKFRSSVEIFSHLCYFLRGQGGLHENFAEIDLLVVSDRGDRYLSDAFGPVKNIVPSRSYCW